MMNYQRKPIAIKGYECYECDTDGVVYSKTGKPLKFSINHRGYCIIGLCMNGVPKYMSVHSVIAKTFVPNPDPINKNQVNHINGVKTDNRAENLEWVTPKENTDHARNVLGYCNTGKYNTKAKRVVGYDRKTNEKIYEFDSLADAARYFSPDNDNRARHIQNVISLVTMQKNGKKSYHGCRWEYID